MANKSQGRMGNRPTQVNRGSYAKNKDNLKSDRDRTMSAKPAANRDEFGSAHHDDLRIRAQERQGRVHGQNAAFRESAQDTAPDRGVRNKEEGRRRPKGGGPTKPIATESTRKRR